MNTRNTSSVHATQQRHTARLPLGSILTSSVLACAIIFAVETLRPADEPGADTATVPSADAPASIASRIVRKVGDLDADGRDDLAIGVPSASPSGKAGAGSAYVVLGRANLPQSPAVPTKLDAADGFRIDGEAANDHVASALAAAGDVNGDGIDDLIVGAPAASPGARPLAGSVYVVFGRGSGFTATLSLATLDGRDGFRVDGELAGDVLGRSVGTAGDINGDGFDDVVIGTGAEATSPGYVIFGRGRGFPATLVLSRLDGRNGFRIDVADGNATPTRVGSAGDIDGDGLGDLMIETTSSDDDRTSASDRYIVFGRREGFNDVVELAHPDADRIAMAFDAGTTTETH